MKYRSIKIDNKPELKKYYDMKNKLIGKNEEIERLNDIIYGLEEILEREIKIGEEILPDDNVSKIVCHTLKQVLRDLNKLKEGK